MVLPDNWPLLLLDPATNHFLWIWTSPLHDLLMTPRPYRSLAPPFPRRTHSWWPVMSVWVFDGMSSLTYFDFIGILQEIAGYHHILKVRVCKASWCLIERSAKFWIVRTSPFSIRLIRFWVNMNKLKFVACFLYFMFIFCKLSGAFKDVTSLRITFRFKCGYQFLSDHVIRHWFFVDSNSSIHSGFVAIIRIIQLLLKKRWVLQQQ
jgi:hypothetical protein